MDQISIFDILPEKKKTIIQPEIWSCTKYCANYTNVRPDGTKDFFPIPGRVPRCVNLEYGKTTLIDNVWHSYCKNYKEKEE